MLRLRFAVPAVAQRVDATAAPAERRPQAQVVDVVAEALAAAAAASAAAAAAVAAADAAAAAAAAAPAAVIDRGVAAAAAALAAAAAAAAAAPPAASRASAAWVLPAAAPAPAWAPALAAAAAARGRMPRAPAPPPPSLLSAWAFARPPARPFPLSVGAGAGGGDADGADAGGTPTAVATTALDFAAFVGPASAGAGAEAGEARGDEGGGGGAGGAGGGGGGGAAPRDDAAALAEAEAEAERQLATSSASPHAPGAHAHGDVRAPPASVLEYLPGFGAHHATEALPGALPVGANSPQRAPYGLYAEQLSGSAFTAPRAANARSWLYRIRPSTLHGKLVPLEHAGMPPAPGAPGGAPDPNQMRWFAPPLPAPAPGGGGGGGAGDDGGEAVTWLDGLRCVAFSGSPAGAQKGGVAAYSYTANASMVDAAVYNADGEWLLVPQEGALHVQTEAGFLHAAPGEIVVLPRGLRFRVGLDGPSRGYVLEVYGARFALPELGPIGSNGLANARDFLAPVAAFEDREVDFALTCKFGGRLWGTLQTHSPFDVVAWHGNCFPYKYDLAKFNVIGTVSYDHPDPSIFTVLTAASDTPGVALADFVIFPPRWMVAEGTFRPPWFHRNCMSELMGMVWGKYDAKVGFQPGGVSLHPPAAPHGPDAPTFLGASNRALGPEKFDAGLAFMFETAGLLSVTDYARDAPHRDREYQKCWAALPRVFNPGRREPPAVLERVSLEAAAAAAAAAAGEPAPAPGAFLHGAARGPVLGDGSSAALAAGGGGGGGGGAAGGAAPLSGRASVAPRATPWGAAAGAKRARGPE